MFSRSKHNDTWTQDGARIEIRGSTGMGGKIFGIPWLFFGLYFIYKWEIAVMLDYVRAGNFPGLFANLLAWLLIFAGLFAIFIVPGWMLAFQRRKVIVDRSKGEAWEVNDFIVYRRAKTHSLSEFKRVLLVETVTESKDSRNRAHRTIFQDVRLSRGKPKDYFLTGTMQSDEKAEELGKALAKLTGLPFVAQEESERRIVN